MNESPQTSSRSNPSRGIKRESGASQVDTPPPRIVDLSFEDDGLEVVDTRPAKRRRFTEVTGDLVDLS
jgi:hypothetical protein